METSMNQLIRLATLCVLAVPAVSHAAVNLFACEPEWAALAKEIGGDKVSISAGVTAQQDPHRIEARPSLIARVRSADLVVCTGAELEVGWLPLLLRSAGNGKIQTGQPGYFMASDYVIKLEVPTRLDRSEGDVHPSGNPHVHLDPRNLVRIGQALGERLGRIDPGNAAYYQARASDFAARMDKAMAQWEAQAAPLRGIRVVAHHKDETYLFHWLGMTEVANLEPKPGIPPSAAYLAELLDRMKSDPGQMIVRSAYQDPKPAEWLSSRAQLPVVVLPFTVGGTPAASDLFGLFNDTINRLLAARKAS
jgi:zinc/manganese transport system substrate-binding protein